MRRRAGAGTIATVVLALGLGVGIPGSVAAPESPCAEYATLSIQGLASGVRVVQGLANATIVNEVDASGPSALAQVDSITGSAGRAGIPFSSTAADNAGFAGFDPNDVPTFALSSYPLRPEGKQETGAYSLHATSAQYASTASAEGGVPSSPAGAAANARTSAAAECADDGSVRATADSATDSISIAGVLTIGSVRSHAEVTRTPLGDQTVDATIAFEGAAILGQPVSITDQGVVLGPAVLPLPANPLATALQQAGLSVRYLEAVEDRDAGTAVAPGVEITVAHAVPGVGTGPLTTSITVGQAYAHVGSSAVPAVAAPLLPAPSATVGPSATPVLAGAGTATPSNAEGTAAQAPRAAPAASSSTTRLVDWSIAPAYYALALGLALSFAIRAGIRTLVARLRWT